MIINFQKNLADSLLNFVRKPLLYHNTWEGKFKESFDKYGFPFVGSHWIPHLSIASVKGGGKKIINEFKSFTNNLNHSDNSNRLHSSYIGMDYKDLKLGFASNPNDSLIKLVIFL